MGRPPGHASARLWAGLWLVSVFATLLARPILPVDELRYVGVAWDMWSQGSFLHPVLNGELYAHKPPLLFWLIHAGWAVFGVNEWWPRLLPPLFGLASLALTARLARRLWPSRRTTSDLAPLLLCAMGLWAVWLTLLMFDTLVTTFTLLALLALLSARDGGGARAWLGLGAALGAGMLCKGPVLLVYVLPVALLAPLWMREQRPARWRSWYAGVVAALLAGTAILLAWVLPAAFSGTALYKARMLGGELARFLDPQAASNHVMSWWFYPAVLPLVLWPISCWPRLWRSVRRLLRRPQDDGTRMCLVWFVVAVLVLSLFSAKQEHYLLPAMPALALLSARALSAAASRDRGTRRETLWAALLPLALGLALLAAGRGWLGLEQPAFGAISPLAGALLVVIGLALAVARPGHGRRVVANLAVANVAILMVLLFGVLPALLPNIDARPVAAEMGRAQREHRPVAMLGTNRGQYDFPARLTEPIELLDIDELLDWSREHPQGLVVISRSGRRRHGSELGLPPAAPGDATALVRSADELLAVLRSPDPR